MTGMVETIAAVIYGADQNSIETPFAKLRGPARDDAMDTARAVLEALREPTPEMVEAVAFGDYTTFSYGGDTHSFDYFSEENARDVFKDMIAAALSPQV